MFEHRLASDADRRACEAMIETGSRSFHLASKLLPVEMRSAVYALYAFCRLSDDAVDVEQGSLAAVTRLRARLDAVYAGRPWDLPVDRALADEVAIHDLPRTALEALLEGLEWDATARRYETLSQVRDYAARVAGAVGALMAALMGVRSPDMVARACDLGVAMQLTNIARDVGEDARNGRLYLPRAWMGEAGLDPDAWLAAPRFSPALGSVVQRLLVVADDHYARADAAIARLPTAFRPAIFAARLLYAEIGRVVERCDCDSVAQRAIVPNARKRALLVAAIVRSLAPAPPVSAEHVAETAFLVEATTRPPRPRPSWWRLDDHVVWVAGLFARLDRRDWAQRERVR